MNLPVSPANDNSRIGTQLSTDLFRTCHAIVDNDPGHAGYYGQNEIGMENQAHQKQRIKKKSNIHYSCSKKNTLPIVLFNVFEKMND
jgi:hypothetical protein